MIHSIMYVKEKRKLMSWRFTRLIYWKFYGYSGSLFCLTQFITKVGMGDIRVSVDEPLLRVLQVISI